MFTKLSQKTHESEGLEICKFFPQSTSRFSLIRRSFTEDGLARTSSKKRPFRSNERISEVGPDLNLKSGAKISRLGTTTTKTTPTTAIEDVSFM